MEKLINDKLMKKLLVEKELFEAGLIKEQILLKKIQEDIEPVPASAPIVYQAKPLVSDDAWVPTPDGFVETLIRLAKVYGVGKFERALGYKDFGITRWDFAPKTVRIGVVKKVQLIMQTKKLSPYLPFWANINKSKRQQARHSVTYEQHTEAKALIEILLAQGWDHDKITQKTGLSNCYTRNVILGHQKRIGKIGYDALAKLAKELGLDFKN